MWHAQGMEYKKCKVVRLKNHPDFNKKWLQQRIASDGRKLKGSNIFQVCDKLAEWNVAGSIIFEQDGKRIEMYRRSVEGNWTAGPGLYNWNDDDVA